MPFLESIQNLYWIYHPFTLSTWTIPSWLLPLYLFHFLAPAPAFLSLLPLPLRLNMKIAWMAARQHEKRQKGIWDKGGLTVPCQVYIWCRVSPLLTYHGPLLEIQCTLKNFTLRLEYNTVFFFFFQPWWTLPSMLLLVNNIYVFNKCSFCFVL